MTPDVTLTGLLQTIAGVPDPGSVVITLVNCGSNQPEVNGNSLLSQMVTKVQAGADGTFSVNLWGNDQITPQNTLYEIAFYPSGSLAPTSVKTFQLNSGTYNLASLVPAVTSAPPTAYTPVVSVNGKTGNVTLTAADVGAIPLGTVISGSGGSTIPLFNLASYAANIIFDFSTGLTQKVVLTGAATVSFENAPVGQIVTLIISQDVIGNHPATFASNISGVSNTGPQPNSSSVFQFIYDGTNYLLVGSPVINQ